MKNNPFNFLYVVLASTLYFTACGSDNTAGKEMYGTRPIGEVVDALTLEQKINLVVGTTRGHVNPPFPAPGMPVRHSEGPTTNLSDGKVKGAAAFSYSIDSLNIPVITYADGPAGVRIDPIRGNSSKTYYCTAFPTGISLAASWDTAAVRKTGEAIGNEA